MPVVTSRAAVDAASLWQPADVASALAPGLAAASPGAHDLVAKLVLAADTAGGSGGFAAQWLRAKLTGPGRTAAADGSPAAGVEQCGVQVLSLSCLSTKLQ